MAEPVVEPLVMEPVRPKKICVFGSGTFGTALGTVAARNGFDVTLLTRRDDVAKAINTDHANPHHLSQYGLPLQLSATTSAAEALKDVSFVIHCIPVQSTESFLAPLATLIPPDVPIISASKGVHRETLETMQELVPRVLGRLQPMAFLSGPTFAKELMEAYPSGAILAAEDSCVATACAGIFHCPVFRCYTTNDVIGVEVGGAMKNVYALAAGTVEGMGLGTNTIAFLVTRACAEMNELAVAMGARAHTMAGLSGIGDLMLTCMGGASRNKAVGMRIGKGESVESVLHTRERSLEGVAEGVATAPAALALSRRYGVDMPLVKAVNAVLHGGVQAREAIAAMMKAPPRPDFSAAAADAEVQRGRSNPEVVAGAGWQHLAAAEAVAWLGLGALIAAWALRPRGSRG